MKMGEVGKTVSVGVLGLGHRGYGQTALLASMPDVRIQAVYDPYPDRVQRMLNRLAELVSYPVDAAESDQKLLEREDLDAVAQVVRRHDLLVISDEIYSELVYGGPRHVSFASVENMYERTITINGFSKAFAMTGWRVGYACGAEEIISVMNKIHQYAIMCAPRQGQTAAAFALKSGREDGYAEVLRMRDSYDRRRRLMVDAFRSMGLHCFEPYGAFYAFPSIKSSGLTSNEFCERFLMEKGVSSLSASMALGIVYML